MVAALVWTIGLALVALAVLAYYLVAGALAPLPHGLRSVARFTPADDASVRDVASQFQAVIRDVGEPILSNPSSKQGGRLGVALALLDPGTKAVAFHATFGRVRDTSEVELELRSGFPVFRSPRKAARRILLASDQSLRQMKAERLRWSADRLEWSESPVDAMGGGAA